MLRATIESGRGNVDEAITLLEPLRSYERGIVTGLGTNYMRGYFYLQQRRGNEAIAEFKKIIDNPGIDPFSPARPLAHLGLARAAVVNGDTSAARKAYQDFFALWKDADPDLPVIGAGEERIRAVEITHCQLAIANCRFESSNRHSAIGNRQ